MQKTHAKNLHLNNARIERDVIRALVGSKGNMLEFLDKLEKELFVEGEHRAAFDYILEKHKEGKVVGIRALVEKLNELGFSSEWAFDKGLLNREELPLTIQTLRELAEKRRVYDMAEEVQDRIMKGESANKIAGIITRRLVGEMKQPVIDVQGIMTELSEELKRFHEGKKLVTGIKGLDEKLPPFIRGHVWIIGARTGGAKSWTALQLAKNIVDQGGNVTIFSTEMMHYENLGRILGNEFEKAYHTFWQPQTGINFFDTENVKAYLKKVEEHLFISHQWRSVDEIALQCRNLLYKKKLDVVIVDFFQNLDINSKDTYEGYKRAAQQLQTMAKDLKITVIITSQLSNSFANRMDSFENVEYKNAGEIAASADVGLLLAPAKEVQENNLTMPKEYRPINCIIAKSRHTYIDDGQNKVPLVLKYPSGRIETVPDEYNWLDSSVWDEIEGAENDDFLE